MKIVPISLPTPFYIGPVNVYLIAEDPVTLIDTGPKTRDAIDALRAGQNEWSQRLATFAASCSRTRTRITAVWRARCAMKRRMRKCSCTDGRPDIAPGVLSMKRICACSNAPGVPDDEIQSMRRLYEEVRQYADSLDEDHCRELVDGDELEFETGALRVVHTPGHTPGSCSFVREADRTVIAGDCVLKRITPNPMLSPDPIDPSRRFRSLAEYLVSLARVRSFAPTLIYGGHGEPIHDFEEVFNRYLKLIRERQASVIASIPKSGATAWEVSRAVFPNADDVHSFLAVSEAVAHLDYAHSEGKIALEIGDGREVYRRMSTD